MDNLEKGVLWYIQNYKHVIGGYRPEAWAAVAAGSLSRKHKACYEGVFDQVYAAISK